MRIAVVCDLAMTESCDNAKIHQKITEFLDRAEEGVLVKSINHLLKFLASNNIAQKMVLPPGVVGISPLNRDGFGISAGDVHELISDIISMGHDEDAVNAVCVDLEGDEFAKAKAFNKDLYEGSNGMLPVQCVDSLRYFAVWGAHANTGYQCVAFGMPHDDPTITVDGKLSLEKIKKLDEGYAHAASTGVQWTVIPFFILRHHDPRMSDLLQQAGNATAQIARNEGQLQLLRKCFNAYLHERRVLESKATENNPAPPVRFSDVKHRILKSKPPHADTIPMLYTFVLKFSGGLNARWLLRSERLIKAVGSAGRVIGADIWEALAMSEIPHSIDQAPLVRHAVLQCLYTAKLATNAKSVAITASDVKKLCNKDYTADVLEADKVIAFMYKKLTDADVKETEFASLFIDMSISLVGRALSINKITTAQQGVIPGETIGSIAHNFIEKMNASKNCTLVSDWTPAPPKPGPKTSKTADKTPKRIELQMRSYNEDGEIQDPSQALRELSLGWEVGIFIKKKSENAKFRIDSVIGQKIRLEKDDGTFIDMNLLDIKDDWEKYKEATSSSKLEAEDKSSIFALANLDFLALEPLADIQLKLLEASRTWAPVLTGLDLIGRSIVTNRPFKKGELVLVPETSRIKYGSKEDLGDKLGLKFINLGVFLKHEDTPIYFCLAGQNNKNFCSPFFDLVNATTDQKDEANMVLDTISNLGRLRKKAQIPCLRNSKPIAAEVTLKTFKKTGSLLDAGSGTADSVQTPAKKPRT